MTQISSPDKAARIHRVSQTAARQNPGPEATAPFAFQVKATGRYEVRVAWQPHVNRARTVPVTVQSSDGETTVMLDQSQPTQGANGFQSLGKFHFAANEPAAVLYRVAGAKGIVHIDAVQVVATK